MGREFKNCLLILKLVPMNILGENPHNDPAAGSPTATLLRLLLPLDDKHCLASWPEGAVQQTLSVTQSVATTGGVYKWQGRIQCRLMTCAY